MPGVSAGSNQVGASEMCTAHVSCPSGPAAAPAPGEASRQSRAARSASAVGAKGRWAIGASFGRDPGPERWPDYPGPAGPVNPPGGTRCGAGEALAGLGAVGGGERRQAAVIQRRELPAAAQHQLLEDVGQVRLDRRLGDVEAAGHLLIAEPARDELGDVLLAAAQAAPERGIERDRAGGDRKSTRLNSSHLVISYAVFCL